LLPYMFKVVVRFFKFLSEVKLQNVIIFSLCI
jgi:hypothetical protein